MKFFTQKTILQKICISIVLVVLLGTSVAMPKAYAFGWTDLPGKLLKEFTQLIVLLADSVNGLFNQVMLGVDWDDLMLSETDVNLDPDSGSWLAVSDDELKKAEENGSVLKLKRDKIDGKIFGLERDIIPNILYSPENIFANKIAAFDVNFLSPNKYNPVRDDGGGNAKKKAKSTAGELRDTISSWYKAFRNIAIVGLLSVLIYLGIRILLSSTAPDKAKYKEMLKDWLVALCLVFAIHFIMSFILMVTDRVNELFSSPISEGMIVKIDNGTRFRTNLVGYVRMQANQDSVYKVVAYSVMYIAILAYTIMFTFTYFKRFLTMAFFTMIAPLVALTYPLDRVGDRKSTSI